MGPDPLNRCSVAVKFPGIYCGKNLILPGRGAGEEFFPAALRVRDIALAGASIEAGINTSRLAGEKLGGGFLYRGSPGDPFEKLLSSETAEGRPEWALVFSASPRGGKSPAGELDRALYLVEKRLFLPRMYFKHTLLESADTPIIYVMGFKSFR